MVGGIGSRLESARYNGRYFLRHLFASVGIGMLASVGFLSWSLAGNPQLVELYAVELSRASPDGVALVSAVGAAVLFSLLVYSASRNLPKLFVFAALGDRTPGWTQFVREGASLTVALAPWVGMAFGLGRAAELIGERRAALGGAVGPLGPGIEAVWGLAPLTVGYLAIAGGGLSVLAGVGLWWLHCGAGRPRFWRSRWSRARYWIAHLVGLALLAAALIVCCLLTVEPAFGTLRELGVETTALLQRMGPIACVFLALSAVFSLVLIILIFIPGVIAPEIALLATAGAVVWGLFWTSETAPAPSAERSAERPFEAAFRAWADGTAGSGEGSSAKTPVYVIAASGGGAYAAAHAGHTLAALQDADPRFASRVFAISGVSGGSVGATVFRAVDAGASGGGASGGFQSAFRGAFGEGPRARAVREIVLGAHLGPLVAQVPGAALTKIRGRRADAKLDRADSLSETYAAAARDLRVDGIDGAAAGAFLEGGFGATWRAEAGKPALVLNATSVEHGEPVAFAPFDLLAASRGSVSTFREWFPDGAPRLSAMQAAVVSARFPGVLPAFSHKNAQGWTNFVDGGYADSSGAGTAFEIFRAIERAIAGDAALQARFEPRLLLLVGSYRSDRSGATGTRLVDTLAPLYTILRVRDQQAQRSVARTIAAFDPAERDRVVRIIDLDTIALKLPLAWRLSASTYDAVAASVGRPEECGRAVPSDAHPVVRIRAKNSCALQWVLGSL